MEHHNEMFQLGRVAVSFQWNSEMALGLLLYSTALPVQCWWDYPETRVLYEKTRPVWVCVNRHPFVDPQLSGEGGAEL